MVVRKNTKKRIKTAFTNIFNGMQTILDTSGKDEIYDEFFTRSNREITLKDATRQVLSDIIVGIKTNGNFVFNIPDHAALPFLGNEIDGIYFSLKDVNKNTHTFLFYTLYPLFTSPLKNDELQLLIDTGILYNIFEAYFESTVTLSESTMIPGYITNLQGAKNAVVLNSNRTHLSSLNFLFFYQKFLDIDSQVAQLNDIGIRRLYSSSITLNETSTPLRKILKQNQKLKIYTDIAKKIN